MNILRQVHVAVRGLAREQRRAKTLQPLKWPNDKIMRKGLKHVCRPWELRNDPDVINGHFGLVSKGGGHITERQLENCMLNFKNRLRIKDYDISVRDDAQVFPANRRPQGARHGKGIGDTVQWVLRVRPGTVIFDVKANHHQFINDYFIKQFFRPVQDMLGVPTVWQRSGQINCMDDISYASAQPYMDANYWRRLQDAYPDEQHNKAYQACAKLTPDTPLWNPTKQTREWYPAWAGNDFNHRRLAWTAFGNR
eukprot:TRINITY_DN4704_c0_g1_i1.p1 TRINITY_DN4704_c0_g1~~TRINITY_DN4704_c0_g1_i1.p1  ORF type:complete len:252 (+),score=47.76 TRINITY_DN4704_c0_g1_i1:39-794(+)